MKTKDAFKLFLSLSVISSSFVGAIANDAVLNSDPIDINGYVSEPAATDAELEGVRNDLRKVKRERVVNKEKSKNYKKLAKEAEKLSDVTEEMIEDRKESKDILSKYNKKIECLMQENPGADCDDYVKRKDSVSMKMAAPAQPQVVAAFGLSIRKPPPMRLSTKSTCPNSYNSIQSQCSVISCMALRSLCWGKIIL